MTKTKTIALALASVLLPAMVFAATTTLTFKSKTDNTSTIAQAATALQMSPAQFATAFPNAKLVGNQTFSTTTGTPDVPPIVIPPVVPTAGEVVLTNVYTTGYGYPDNTPKNSAAISNPVLHQSAGGTGTFADPITVAVGHSITGSTDTLDYPAGTKFYIPNLRRYFIVEDTCGDGSKPQNGACHNVSSAPSGTTVWLDLWVGGVGTTANGTIACENAITDLHTVIKNPASNYAVVAGQVYNGTCSAQFGNSVVTQ